MPEKINLGQSEVLEMVNVNTPLTIDFLGIGGFAAFDTHYVGGYTHITGYVYSEVGSATDGLVIEQAQNSSFFNGVGVTTSKVTSSSMTFSAGDITSNAFSVQIVAPFARVIYTNGAAAQVTDFNVYFCARILRGL